MALRQRLIRWHTCLVSIGAEASSKDSCREIELLAKEAALAVGRLMEDLENDTERAAAMEGSGGVANRSMSSAARLGLLDRARACSINSRSRYSSPKVTDA